MRQRVYVPAESVPLEKLCTKVLSPEDIQKFAFACEEDYYVSDLCAVFCCGVLFVVIPALFPPQFEMFVDDLPVYGYIGEHESEDMILGHTEKSRHYLFTHLNFLITYNGDRVIRCNSFLFAFTL